MDRAYSTLNIKALSEVSGKRTFTGIASTPTTDLGGDIMEPHGAHYTLPIPFLWQHDAKQPIGWIRKAALTAEGIEVEGEVATIPEPGKLRDRVDEAWQSMRARLVRGLSIGFKGIDATPLRGGGMHYKKWLWLELSAVVVPMNSEASIVAIKAADVGIRNAVPTPAMLAAPITGALLWQVNEAYVAAIKALSKRIADLEAKR